MVHHTSPMQFKDVKWIIVLGGKSNNENGIDNSTEKGKGHTNYPNQ